MKEPSGLTQFPTLRLFAVTISVSFKDFFLGLPLCLLSNSFPVLKEDASSFFIFCCFLAYHPTEDTDHTLAYSI